MIATLSDPVILALIAAVSAAITSTLALIKVNSTHKIVNSRMTELLELTRKSAKAEGVKQEADKGLADTPQQG